MGQSSRLLDEVQDILTEAKRGICHASMPRDAASFLLIHNRAENLLRTINDEQGANPSNLDDLARMASVLDA